MPMTCRVLEVSIGDCRMQHISSHGMPERTERIPEEHGCIVWSRGSQTDVFEGDDLSLTLLLFSPVDGNGCWKVGSVGPYWKAAVYSSQVHDGGCQRKIDDQLPSV
jgi:hypothetical protein